MSIPEEAIQFYDTLIGLNQKIVRKGKTTPYTSLNGHMFSFLSKEGIMGLRLSQKDLEEFIVKYKSKVMEQHGRVMKEYVEIPFLVLKDIKLLSPYLEKSLEYVSNLKPKPTKKK